MPAAICDWKSPTITDPSIEIRTGQLSATPRVERALNEILIEGVSTETLYHLWAAQHGYKWVAFDYVTQLQSSFDAQMVLKLLRENLMVETMVIDPPGKTQYSVMLKLKPGKFPCADNRE